MFFRLIKKKKRKKSILLKTVSQIVEEALRNEFSRVFRKFLLLVFEIALLLSLGVLIQQVFYGIP